MPGDGRRSALFAKPEEIYGIAWSQANDVALAWLGADHRLACFCPPVHSARMATLAVHVGAGLRDLRRLQMANLAADSNQWNSLVAACGIPAGLARP